MKAFYDLILCLWILALALQDLSTRKAFTQGRQCEDVLPDCANHFNTEDCDKYSSVTRKYCLKTCNYCPTPPPTILSPCKDILPDCALYIKSSSQCHGAQEFFTKYCPSTCGYCACDDILEDCLSYVSDPNQCQSSPFFTKYCKRTCNICEASTVSTTRTSAMIQPSPSTPTPLKPPPSSTEVSSQSSLTDSLTKFSSTTSPLTKSSSTDSSSAESSSTQESQPTEWPLSSSSPSPSLTNTPSTTKSTIRPDPLGCADIRKDCASIVANDKDSCKNSEMKENCPESCNLCEVDPQCEDNFPEDCVSFVARDKEYCKTNPEYMKENCARTCQYCGCHDLLPLCTSFVAMNKDYCTTNRVFMKTNCPKSCDLCYKDDSDGDVKPPTTSNVLSIDCVDKRKKCQTFASLKNYCTYQSAFMRRNCPKSCQFCEKEYNFEIKTEWNGKQINHAPIKFQISAQDSRVVLISVSGPFFDDPDPPPCAVGSACDELWDYEVAEVFFLGKKEKYLEIELSPHGQHLLLMLNGVRKSFKDKLPIEYTAVIDRAKGSWTGTAKIPIDYFPPGVQKINAYAIHGSGINRRYESLYPASADAKNPDFHRLEFFKPFDFEAMFTLSWSKPASLYWKNIRRLLRARSRT